MKDRDPRISELEQYAKTDVDAYKKGDKPTLATHKELGLLFGYSPSHTGILLHQAGIRKERQGARFLLEKLPFPPSQELAWTVGYLSAIGGTAAGREKPTQLKITAKAACPKIPARNKFEQMAKTLLGTTPTITRHAHSDGRTSEVLFVNNKNTVPRLGNLSEKDFVNTFNERYKWIKQDALYGWRFVEGRFEASANCESRNNHEYGIRFSVNDTEFLNFLVDHLKSLGILKPRPYFIHNHQAPHAIGIFNDRDLKLLAINISSTDEGKENFLANLRKIQLTDRQKTPPQKDCKHRWFIDEPNGPTSDAMCKNCGGEKSFRNSEGSVFNYSLTNK